MLLLMAGCAPVPPPVPLAVAQGTELDLLGEDLAFALSAPPSARREAGFFTVGFPAFQAPATPEAMGRNALQVLTPPGRGAVGRRIDTALTDMPYLSWSWRLQPRTPAPMLTPSPDAPMRLLVGFSGGGTGTEETALSALPPHERAAVILWAAESWQGGAALTRGPYGRFVARAGGSDGRWWGQELDLAALHRRLWPEIEIGAVRITFVAVAAEDTAEESLGEVAQISLAPPPPSAPGISE